MPLTKPLISIAAAILVAAGVFTRVGGNDPTQPSTLAGVEEAVVGTIEKGLEFLSVAIDTVLPYRLPEVLPNGDIIIRYTPLPEAQPPVPPPEDDLPALETSET